MTQRFLFILPFLSACLFAQAPLEKQSALDLASFLPADTAAFVGIRDVKEFLKEMQESPLMEMADMAEEELDDFLETAAVIEELAEGGAAFVLRDIDPIVEQMKKMKPADFELPDDVLDPDAEPEEIPLGDLPKPDEAMKKTMLRQLVFLADVRGQEEAVGDLFAEELPGPKMELKEHEVNGEKLMLAQRLNKKGKVRKQVGWTFREGIALLGTNDKALASIAKAIGADGRAKSLADNKVFKQALANAGDADGFAYIDLNAIMTAADGALLEAEMPEGSGLVPERLSEALQLKAFDPAVMAWDMEEDGLRLRMNYGTQEETRLSKILMPHSEAPAERPTWIPAEVISVQSMRIKPRGIHDAVIDLANNINPQFGAGVPMMALQLKAMIGVDYRRHILDHLGDSIIIAQTFDKEKADEGTMLQGAGYLIGFSIADQKALQGSLEKVLAKLDEDMLVRKKVEGKTVYVAKALAMQGVDLSFTFLDGYLVVCFGDASFSPLFAASKNEGMSIWDTDRFKALSKTIPAEATNIHFMRIDAFAKQMDAMSEALGDEAPHMGDLKAYSDMFDGFLSHAVKKGNHMRNDLKLFYKDEKAEEEEPEEEQNEF